ncbi:YraN family protein [Candidatus Igneacidithiobacillus taiwanensis]|jgi:putative endonuclease|uniref:YraN family protein n=1 Tax=Candidatus Igneacidithiobacillus taiwanensis TaxID=1945924 RepID=UPI0028966426|nr:YraN family protein [Candidatus Igneacidithiobacillus taiwanensis]MCE5361030.1 YraN family protein [Acidithiobacillus sp.]
MPSPTQQKGKIHEARAQALLQARGMQAVEQNFRCRSGEIDLIAQDRDSLVFVEVRSRAHDRQGNAAASIGPRKQQRIIRAAQVYLLRHPQYQSWPCRFDVVSFDGNEEGEWIRDAFQVPYR